MEHPACEQRAEWEAEFEAAARRPLRTRMRYAFIHTYKPVLDDATYRSFDTMEDYRRWCEESLAVSFTLGNIPVQFLEYFFNLIRYTMAFLPIYELDPY